MEKWKKKKAKFSMIKRRESRQTAFPLETAFAGDRQQINLFFFQR